MFSVCERDKMSVASLFIFLIIMLRRHLPLNMSHFELQIVDIFQNVRSPGPHQKHLPGMPISQSVGVVNCRSVLMRFPRVPLDWRV